MVSGVLLTAATVFGCESEFKCVWDHVVRRIPPSLRVFKGPFRVADRFFVINPDVSSDDSYLAVNIDEAMSSPYVRRNPDGWEGWLFAGVVPSGRHVSVDLEDMAGLLAYALYSCRDGSSSFETPSCSSGTSKVPLRGEGPRRLASGMFVPEFRDVGPWI